MPIERRGFPRAELRVPLYLLPVGSSLPIRTETENVGVDGFFCYSRFFFSPGERLKFLMLLPSAPVEGESGCGIRVGGEAEVTRVSVGPVHQNYGVACRLRSYHILPASNLLPSEEILVGMLDPSAHS
ncbi:MAG: hypothetical protein ACJ746_02970 [Bryobacteraceae bacterium]